MIELTNDELTMLKQCELDIFKCFIAACNELKLRYYIVGGTLIGAVRHGGFIPWDDDIDIVMPRQDYDLFMEKGQNYLPEYLFLQTHRTDPLYPHCFAKIRNKNTVFVEYTSRKINMETGVYIDIFPLDYYPVRRKKQLMMEFTLKFLHASVCRLFDVPVSLIKKIVLFILSFILPSPYKALESLEKLISGVQKSQLVRNYGGAWGKKEIFHEEWFGKGVEIEFEGMKVMAPTNYDAILRNVYGDYMKLPPVEQRKPHHYLEKFRIPTEK